MPYKIGTITGGGTDTFNVPISNGKRSATVGGVSVGILSESPLGVVRLNTTPAKDSEVVITVEDLNLDFITYPVLDSRITFTRSTGATRFNEAGVMVTEPINGPRFDYDPVTREPRGLLIEEQRTNSIRNNTMVGTVAGTPGTLPNHWGSFATSGLTIAVDGSGVQSGINYIDLKISGTSNNTFLVLAFDTAAASASAGQTWTESFWCSLVGGSTANISSINVNLRQTGGAGNTFDSAFTPTSTFTRFINSGTLTTGATGVYGALAMFFGSGVVIDFTLRIGLPQLELGAFATSAIPTTAAQATRAADGASISGANFSSWYNQTEGTVVTQSSTLPGVLSPVLTYALSDGTFNNSMYGNFTSGNLCVGANVIVSGVGQAGSIGAFSIASSVNNTKDAFTYKLNSFAESCNGATTRLDTSGTVPTVNRLYLGANWGGIGNFLNGYIRSFTYYPKQLTASELQELTA